MTSSATLTLQAIRAEMNYPDIVAAIQEIGYTDYVGHEFIPTRDPADGFSAAVSIFNT